MLVLWKKENDMYSVCDTSNFNSRVLNKSEFRKMLTELKVTCNIGISSDGTTVIKPYKTEEFMLIRGIAKEDLPPKELSLNWTEPTNDYYTVVQNGKVVGFVCFDICSGKNSSRHIILGGIEVFDKQECIGSDIISFLFKRFRADSIHGEALYEAYEFWNTIGATFKFGEVCRRNGCRVRDLDVPLIFDLEERVPLVLKRDKFMKHQFSVGVY